MIFKQVKESETHIIFSFLKDAAVKLQKKGIDQWQIWHNPDLSRIKWIEDGVLNNEFYFVEIENDIVGMFRLQTEDLLYWGKQDKKALYIHSLYIKDNFAGKQLGLKVINKITEEMKQTNINLLRLDCNAHNPFLCKYYENLGFKSVGIVNINNWENRLYEMYL